jgi:uncharacterized protein (DUF608 family)
VAAFPLGGIGTGNVSLGARGELRDWEIFNSPAKGNKLRYTFFALRATSEGSQPVTKVLESQLLPPHQGPFGSHPDDVPGLPRLRESRMRGEYPLCWIDFEDDELPVSVSLEAFTPFVPLDAAESGIPAAVLRYRVRNIAKAAVDVTVVGSLYNPLSVEVQDPEFPYPRFAGAPKIEFFDDGVLRGLYLTASLPENHLKHGTITLLTTSPNVTAKPDWPASHYGLDDFWTDLCEDGRLETSVPADTLMSVSLTTLEDDLPPEVTDPVREADEEREKNSRMGSLGIVETLAPGEARTFEFALAWHFPNRPKGWPAEGMLKDTKNAGQIDRNFYATRFGNALEVAQHLHAHLPELEAQTRAFHDSLFNSSLPVELVDAVAANITVLRSTTCFRLEDGTFAGWEGVSDDAGCCPGSCTHVWNYAQTAAFLFPELERSMRRVELARETDADGRMNFRTNFGRTPLWQSIPLVVERWKRPAADGQLGTIIRLYREWKFSGDDELLADLWPNVVKALEFAFGHWDTDGDFVLDGYQHTTYDIEFYGPNPLTNSIFSAALRAAAEMAEHLGQTERAERYRDAATRGAEAMDRLLWNGEYYIQHLDDINARPYQYGSGCLSDQLLGQLLAHVAGLGYVLPPDHVKQAIASVHRYNYRSNLRNQRNLMRAFALEDEGGLVLCSWPHGGRPWRPFYFADEVWTGVEYQVAAHLIYEGLVDEGLEIVRTVRERHDGYRRSPWNEAECGYHYARSLSSWALLLAYSGFAYDATKQAIDFAPAVSGDFRCLFSTGTGWGTFSREATEACIELRYGTLWLSRLGLRVATGVTIQETRVNGSPLATQVQADGERTRLTFELVKLAAGDVITVSLDGGASLELARARSETQTERC